MPPLIVFEKLENLDGKWENQKIWTENEEKEAKMGKLENLDGK